VPDINIAIIKLDAESAAALSKPIVKMIEAVQQVFRPGLIVKTAKAKGKAAVIQAQADVAVREILDAAETDRTRRAMSRFIAVETERQENMEAVIDESIRLLPESVSETPVDPGWIATFFDCVKDVSEKDLRTVWAKLLANEVTEPGACSRRTLRILQDLAPDDAAVFGRACSVALTADQTAFIPVSRDTGIPYFISYDDCLRLISCGLLAPAAVWTVTKSRRATLKNGTTVVITAPATVPGVKGMPFTRSGIELSRIVGPLALPQDLTDATVDILLQYGVDVAVL